MEKIDNQQLMEQIHNDEIDARLGYAVEDGRLDLQEALEMSYSEKEEWLSRFDHDYDPY